MTLQQQLQKLNIIPEEKEWNPIPEVEKRNQGFNQALYSINYDLLEQFFTDRFIEMVESKEQNLSFMNDTENDSVQQVKGYRQCCVDLLSTLKNYKNEE